jgi:hypothetical protein
MELITCVENHPICGSVNGFFFVTDSIRSNSFPVYVADSGALVHKNIAPYSPTCCLENMLW